MTRIIGIVMVKNETAFIETALKNAADFCDEMILIDNYSSDGTYDLLKDFSEKKKRCALMQMENPKHSHQLLSPYAGKDVFVFGIDGDEIYHPRGLARLRRRILGGEFNTAWCVYGHVMHCISVDLVIGKAVGYPTPPARSMVKLYNFSVLSSWNENNQQRLHGKNMVFKEGFSVNSSRRLYLEEPWSRCDLKCLHMCFVPRSAAESNGEIVRQNISENAMKRQRAQLWKHEHYRRGEAVERTVSEFFPTRS